MNLFNRHKDLDFSDKNIESLSESVTELKSILRETGMSTGLQELTNILASAMKKDSKLFRKYILTNELFGGTGALWELYCGNDNLQTEFQNRFRKFCMELKNIGINNRRINQVINGLK